MDDPRVGEQRRNHIQCILTKVLMKPIFQAPNHSKTPSRNLVSCIRRWRKEREGESQSFSGCTTPHIWSPKYRDEWLLTAINTCLLWRVLVIIGCVAILLFVYNHSTEKIERNSIDLSAGEIGKGACQYAGDGSFSYPTPSPCFAGHLLCRPTGTLGQGRH